MKTIPFSLNLLFKFNQLILNKAIKWQSFFMKNIFANMNCMNINFIAA